MSGKKTLFFLILYVVQFCRRLSALAHGADEFAFAELDVQVFFGLGLLGAGDDVAAGVVDDGVAAREGGERAQGMQGAGEVVELLLPAFEGAADAAVQAFAQFVGTLDLLLEAALGVLELKTAGEGVVLLPAFAEDVLDALGEAGLLLGEEVEDGGLRRAGEFSGSSGCGGAEICGKVGQGDVGFVADAADDGDAALADGADEVGVVEAPEVFEAAAAADEEEGVAFVSAVGGGDLRDEFGCGGFALDGAGVEDDGDGGVAAGEGGEGVVDGGACGRGDDADGARERGDGAFAGGVEVAFAGEAGLQFEVGAFEVAAAKRFELVDDELVVAAGFVEREAAVGAHGEAVVEVALGDFQAVAAAFEKGAGDLGLRVFEAEVKMAGGGAREVGDFAFDPDAGEVVFEEVADGLVEFADGVGVVAGMHVGRGWVVSAEVYRQFCEKSLRGIGESDGKRTMMPFAEEGL